VSDDKKPRHGLHAVDPEAEVATVSEGGKVGPVIGKRCRICRDDQVRGLVNDLLAHGHSYASILSHLQPVNDTRAGNRQITKDVVHQHKSRHFNLQEPARAIWRRRLEERRAESGLFDDGVAHLVDSAAFFETVMHRAYETVVDPDTTVDIGLGLSAARSLHELMRTETGIEQMARMQAQMNRIVAAFRTLPPNYQQQMLDQLDGKTAPVIEAGPAAEFVGRNDEDEDLGGDGDDD